MPYFSEMSCALRRFCLFIFVLLAARPMWAGSTTVVISQLYGAGGNSGATYNADYVELFNLSASTVTLSGYALQYGSATGSTISQVSPLPSTITLAPGQRYLISASPGTVGASLPVTADTVISSIAFGAAAGRVFLTSSTTQLANSCPGAGGTVVDFVGYGTTATCFEGNTFAPAPSATAADIRTNPCTDTDQNGVDFTVGTPAPRSSASTATSCFSSPVALALNAAITPAVINAGATTLLTATVTAGTQPASTGLVVTADTSALGGTSTQPLYDDGTHNDVTAGDGIYSYLLTVPGTQAAKTYTVNFKVSDTQLRASTASATLEVDLSGTRHSSITVSSSSSSVVAGTSVTLTAIVTGDSTTKPGGMVTFADQAGTLGTGMLNAGVATFVTTALSIGVHTISASYGGDSTYPTAITPSTPAVTVTVTAAPVPDFTFSVQNATMTLSGGQPKQSTIVSAAFVNGFTGTVTFACTGLSSGETCAFRPATLSATGTSTLTVAVDGAQAQLKDGRISGGREILAFGLLALPLLMRRKLRSRLAGAALGVLMLGAMMATVSGCGSNAASTPSGSGTLTITATGGNVTHSTTLSVVVQ